MGYFYVLLSSLLFGILPSIQNKAILNGAGPLNVLFVCNSICLIGSLFLCLYRHVDLRITKKEILIYLLSGNMGLFVTDLCLNLAYTKMPVGLVTMIHFAYPVLVCSGAVLFFKEKLSRNKIIAIFLSISGLILLGDPKASYSFEGVLFALISAFAYALNLTIVDRSLIAEHHVFLKNFYLYLFSTASSILANASKLQTIQIVPDQMIWLLIAGIILMSGSICLTKGIRILGSSNAAFISTMEPITSLLVSTFLYHYDFQPRSIFGCVLIILSLIPIIKDD
ncbi:MAG: DMT family transporter [Erysipelotrichaceae bacterium]|nr:DMT family transporter [Erysipelotrichaceae bacterium]